MLRKLLLLILSCLLPAAAWAAGEMLRIGTADVAPYGAVRADGQNDGVFLQLANLIAERAGLPHVNGVYPPARLYAMLQRHELDLAISSRALDRDLGLVNLGKVWQMEGRIVYRDALRITPHTLADFAPFLIGRIGGTCPPLARANMRLYDLSSYEQGLRMLTIGHLDALCGDSGGLSAVWHGMPSDQAAHLKTFTFLTTDVWVFASPALPERERQALGGTLHAMLASGEIAQFFDRHLPNLPAAGREGG